MRHAGTHLVYGVFLLPDSSTLVAELLMCQTVRWVGARRFAWSGLLPELALSTFSGILPVGVSTTACYPIQTSSLVSWLGRSALLTGQGPDCGGSYWLNPRTPPQTTKQ